MPGARCTRSPVCRKKTHGQKPQVHRNHPAFPHAMVLTVSFALSSVTNSFCHRRQRIKVLSKPGRVDIASANLTPTTGARTTRLLRPHSVVRPRAGDCSQVLTNPPCDPIARPTLPRPPHPAPRP